MDYDASPAPSGMEDSGAGMPVSAGLTELSRGNLRRGTYDDPLPADRVGLYQRGEPVDCFRRSCVFEEVGSALPLPFLFLRNRMMISSTWLERS